jgi:DNA-binding transcriptional regulator YdaS (Cro superfamily)
MTKAEALKFFGGAKATAKALGINRSAVNQWKQRVPLLRQQQIERLSNGLLKADDIPMPHRRESCPPTTPKSAESRKTSSIAST